MSGLPVRLLMEPSGFGPRNITRRPLALTVLCAKSIQSWQNCGASNSGDTCRGLLDLRIVAARSAYHSFSSWVVIFSRTFLGGALRAASVLASGSVIPNTQNADIAFSLGCHPARLSMKPASDNAGLFPAVTFRAKLEIPITTRHGGRA